MTFKRLENGLFSRCRFKDFECFEGIETIGDGCFDCNSLQRLTVSSSVREIGNRLFSCCQDLKVIKFVENSRLERIDEKDERCCGDALILIEPGMKFDIEKYIPYN